VLRKLDALYGFRLDERRPEYQIAEQTLLFGLNLTTPRRELPENLRDVRTQVAEQFRQVRNVLQQLLEISEPEDKDTPAGPPLSTQETPDALVRKHLPERKTLIDFLSTIVNVQPSTTIGKLTTVSLNRDVTEPRDTESLSEDRAADLVRNNPELAAKLRDAGDALKTLLAEYLTTVHAEVVKILQLPNAGQIAKRYYACFDYFDAIQYPISFGTDVSEPDVVDIIRICPEDAPALVDSVDERPK
jgi:hypothetical protein